MSQRLENISTQMEIILSAIYMATSHISDEQNIKKLLKLAALQVMAETIELVGDESLNRATSTNYIDNSNSNINNLKSNIKVNIYKSMSFIKVMKSERLMTDRNADLLIVTYNKLLSFINQYYISTPYTVSDNIKDINYDLYTDMSNSDNLYLNGNISLFNKSPKKVDTNINLKNKNINQIYKNINQIYNRELNNGNKLNRKDYLLSIIKHNLVDGYNMSEILTKIREIDNAELRSISEKTVQRELNSMVLDGLIVKKGEKRWSRYVLASALL